MTRGKSEIWSVRMHADEAALIRAVCGKQPKSDFIRDAAVHEARRRERLREQPSTIAVFGDAAWWFR